MKPGFDFTPPHEAWSDGFGGFSHPPFFRFFEIPGWMAFVSLVIGALLYFVPTLVAFRRRHHNRAAIALLNVLLGWTFFGWAVALIWAATAVRPVGERLREDSARVPAARPAREPAVEGPEEGRGEPPPP